jgi:DNA-binding LacI/PurR family transcriptional regulator
LLVVACPPPFTVQKIRNAMNRHGVTAACFHGDLPACCAIHELRKAGVRVPEDLTVTGFDGMLLPFSQGQRLTTLAIPVEDMIHKVYDIVTGRETGVRCCLPLEFIKGQTHGSARPDAPTK